MKKFKLYGFQNDTPILITDSENLSPASTFEENMNLEWNMKGSLTFKISDKLSDGIEANPYIGLVYDGALIRVELFNGTTYDVYDFMVKNLSSEFHKNLIIYSVTAEDYASVKYSKEGQGLSLDFTGTFKEIVQEILFLTRKNLGYRNLSKNYLDFTSYYDVSSSLKRSTYSINGNISSATPQYITFYRDETIGSYLYNFSVNLLDIPTGATITVKVTELDSGGIVIKETTSAATPRPDPLVGTPVTISITPSKYASYFKFTFTSTNGIAARFEASDFKIKLDESNNASIIAESLHISSTFDESQFKGELGDASYYKKATISLSNSNLYNGLVEAAKLFNATIEFDYVNNALNFRNRLTYYGYKGYRLSPDFNLLSLTRDEVFDEYNSALHVSGGDKVYSIYPEMPDEFKHYFQDCIDNNFTGANYFQTNTYDSNGNSIGFSTAAEYIIATPGYIVDEEDIEERKRLIRAFAKAADKVPNFENVIYNIDYFNKIGRISTTELNNTFKPIIYDDLRKLNIKLRVYASRYQEAVSLLSSKESQIDFYARNLVVENLALKDVEAELNSDKLYTVTANSAAGVLSLMGPISETYTTVHVKIKDTNTEVLPPELSTTTTYYIVDYDGVAYTCKLSLTSGGAPITFADAGTKTWYISLDGVPAVLENTPEWIALTNEKQTIEENIYNYTQDLLMLYNILYDPELNPTGLELNTKTIPYKLLAESYTALSTTVYGYYNFAQNGIQKTLSELNKDIRTKTNTRIYNNTQIPILESQIAAINNEEDPQSIQLSVKLAGLKASNNDLIYYIGDEVVGVNHLMGIYDYKKQYLQIILDYLGDHSFRRTFINYGTWKVGTPTIGEWSSVAGYVNTVLEPNKNLVNDLMVKLGESVTTTGTIKTTTNLLLNKTYRASGILKVKAGVSGTFKVSLKTTGGTVLGSQTIVLTTNASDRWIGFEYYPNSTGSAAHSFPSYTDVSFLITDPYTITTSGTYVLEYEWSASNEGVFLYRPRMDLVSATMPTIEDMYFLYDNSLGVNYNQAIQLQFNIITGLYDLLYNENYTGNITIQKQQLLHDLYSNYKDFLIDGYYENTEEIDSEGLLEQSLISFAYTSYPKINYGVSVIDLSALEDYRFINVLVGDKIKIAEENDRLYKTYQTDLSKYLQVTGISYNLRQPEATTLTVAQDSETTKLLQYIIKAIS